MPDSWDESNIIEDINVAYNNFTGPRPASLGNTPFLKDFIASQNQLTGSIPTEFYKLERLEELYLDENKLGGELPQTDEPFYDGLQEFSIHSNNFEGRFPVEHFEETLRISKYLLSDFAESIPSVTCANLCICTWGRGSCSTF